MKLSDKSIKKVVEISLLTLTTFMLFTPESFAGAESFDANMDAELARLLPMVGKVSATTAMIIGTGVSWWKKDWSWVFGALATSVLSVFGGNALGTLFAAVV